MFAAVCVDGSRAAQVLAPGRATKLAGPQHQRVFEQPALLQVFDEPCDGLIGLLAQTRQIAADVAVMVPAVHRYLYEPHSRLTQLASQQAGAAVLIAGVAAADAVKIERGLALAREIDQLRRCGLHAEGKFHVLDHPFHVGVAVDLIEQPLVELPGEIKSLPLNGLGGRSVPQILDRQCLVIERHRERRPLMCGRQKSRAVGPHAGCMDTDETRQILVLGTEAVADPRAHRRPNFREDARVKLVRRAGVLRVVGVHATQKADVIRDVRQVRHQVGNHHARLAARPNR